MLKSKNTKVAPVGFVSYVMPHGAGIGEMRPAVIVKINADGTCNLQVFTNGAGDELPNIMYVANVARDEKGARGTWH